MKKTNFLRMLGISCIFLFQTCFATTLKINNQFISYTETGHGKPLVLIHAFLTDKRLWEAQHQGLKDKFRVISLDLRGFGESSAVDGRAITMEEYAEDVKQLLDALHVEKAIVGGESMGGYIAMAFLKNYPEKVDGLILSNTQAVPDDDQTKAIREKIALDVLKNGSQQLAEGFIKNVLPTSVPKETKDMLRHIVSMQSPNGIASALRGMALRPGSTELLLANTTLPVLIITSEDDKVISAQQSIVMHTQSQNSQLVILKDAGHLSNLTLASEWNEAVTNAFADEAISH